MVYIMRLISHCQAENINRTIIFSKTQKLTLAFMIIIVWFFWYFENCGDLFNKSHELTIIKTKSVPEFVLYACIFGNYRNEESGIERALQALKITSSRHVDCFLFTDSKKISNIKGWTVVQMETDKGVNGIPGSRLSVKRLKFQGHEKLEPYRYRIWIDTSRRTLGMVDIVVTKKLLDYVRCHRSKALVSRKHPVRQTIQQEINAVKNLRHIQPKRPLEQWDAFLRPSYGELNRVQLPDTNIFVLDTQKHCFVNRWASIYDTLLANGLFRDQIVYSYAVWGLEDQVVYIDSSPSKLNFTCPVVSKMESTANVECFTPPTIISNHHIPGHIPEGLQADQNTLSSSRHFRDVMRHGHNHNKGDGNSTH